MRGIAAGLSVVVAAGCAADKGTHEGSDHSELAPPAWVGQDVLLPGSSHKVVREVSYLGENDSFADFSNMSGVGPKIPVGTVVDVDCMMFDRRQWGNTTRGVYYHLIGPDALKSLFSVANTFHNNSDGRTDNRYDPNIPLCPQSPAGSEMPPIHSTDLPPLPTK